MRTFIVLGFATNSNKEAGECLYLGCDRGAAIDAANKQTENHRRKELYELAVPALRRQFPAVQQEGAEETKGDESSRGILKRDIPQANSKEAQ